jgi:MYXO-CTERM domain-containing protein
MRRLSCFLTLASFACLLASPEVRAQDSDAAFQGFLDALQTSRELVLSRTSEDGTDRAEGLRHIIRLIEMQNAPATDDHDVANPHVSRCPSVVCKVGFDNPDFTYINVAPISAEYTYRIHGKRGTVPYISMQIFDNPLGGEVVMTSEDLVVEVDGRYEIILSATAHEGNWMELKPNASRFILRNGFYDWNNEIEASVQVEVIAGPMSGPVPHLTPAEFVSDIAALSSRLTNIPATMQNARDGWPLNDVNEPDPGAFGIPGAGVPSAVSSAGRYSLGEDQALIIETPEPSVVHGGIQLGNLWVESIDYQTHQTSLNWFQSTPDDDGIIRYVLAHRDPGVPNWLDISGHADGGIFMRWQSPSDGHYPEKPTVKEVAFDDIRANLPESHPAVTPEERTAALRERYQAVNKRRNPTGQFDAQAQTSGGSSGCSVGGHEGSHGTLWALGGLALVALRRRQRRRRRWH